MSDVDHSPGFRLNVLLAAAGHTQLDTLQTGQFEAYLSLLLRWNARMNLTAVRDEGGILSRHFVESILCARLLPDGILTLLDYGSGAGFPGIPIALCRPEIAITLAESQGRKAAFLREALRVLGIAGKVQSQRAEQLDEQYDCVTLRAVDRMEQAVQTAGRLLRPGGWLALLTTGRELVRMQAAAGVGFAWPRAVTLPGGDDRLIALGHSGC
jgi:16S rRNA (guanine527-N7)-methyltransferase